MNRVFFRLILVIMFIATLLVAVAPAHEALAAGETFDVIAVTSVGCNENDIFLTVQSTGFNTANTYYQHTTAASNGLVYMNQHGSFINSNVMGGWAIFNDSTGGPVTGTFPMTPGFPVDIQIVLESPAGFPIYVANVQLSSCNGVVLSITGNSLNGFPSGDYEKIGQVRVTAPGTAAYQSAGGGVARDSNGNEIWLPNQTAHDPYQDTYDVLDQMEVDGTTWVAIFLGDANRPVWIPVGGVVSPIY